MYSIRDFYIQNSYCNETDIPDIEIVCNETDLATTLLTNTMQDTLAAYTFTLVELGRLTVNYNGRQLSLRQGDLYIYSPGFQVSIEEGSDDYRGICLMADERVTLELPTIRDIIRTAYLPLAEWGEPVVHVPNACRPRLSRRMHEVIEYQQSTHRFRAEVLRTLCTIFLLDLTDIQARVAGTPHHSERTTDLFISFMRLLPKHFIDHRDIAFYASELCITPTHLSRIVRQVSGRTVVDYLNQMLLSEASWLLRSTDLTTIQIADRLRFSSQASFCRFFTRMKSLSPKAYRNGK